jgi:cytochrome c peroxidase
MRLRMRLAAMALSCAALCGCGGGSSGGEGNASRLSPEAALGELAFNDKTLSAGAHVSCASCHSPEAAHAAPNDLSVQWAGPLGDTQGLRASQSLRYLAKNTAFHFDENGKPVGGLFWDGRTDTLAQQAASPLLGPREMANRSKADVAEKIGRTEWAARFRALYGDDILNDADRAFDKLTQALQRFQQEDAIFNAYTSKYDAWLRGETSLGAQEERGRVLFNDPAKGNCAACHPSAKNADDSHPLFTDFSYDNLGIPRNPEIDANQDPNYFDLGLCNRPELLASRADLCGAFKVPSLRNVALRHVYFHNGRFKSLKDALTFYVQRDTNPQKWYALHADGSVNKFDDLPAAYKANVNTTEAPYDRAPGDAPALTDAEVDDVIAFLQTLSDGWQR